MTKEDHIKTLTDELSPSRSEEEEQKGEVEKEIHEEEEPHTGKEEKQIGEEKHDNTKHEPKAEKKTESKVEKGKTTTEKKKRTRTEKKKPKIVQKKASTRKAETKQAKEKTKSETIDTKPTEIGKIADEEEEAQQEEVSPETLARETTIVLVVLSTPAAPKGKRKRQPSMYFKARKNTRIKMGKPQPPSKEPIIIEDVLTTTREESPSKTPLTYETRSPNTSTWK